MARLCKNCVMPDTRPNIIFINGICQPCINYEKRKDIDWGERWTQLNLLCNKHRRIRGYDLLIPCSGGKDSHAQIYFFKKILGMNPLGFMIDNGPSWTKTGRQNFYNMCEVFDIDIITFTPSVKEIKKRMLDDFKNELWPEKYWDEILYSKPMEIAKNLRIKLVAWGENTGEFTGGNGNTIINEISKDYDLKVIYLSDYIPWSRYENLKIAKQFGFKGLDDTGEWNREGLEGFSFEQVDTIGYLVNNYCKFIKFGFSTQTELCSDAIREGKMTRDEAVKRVNEHDWKLDIRMEKDFCSFLGITRKLFWEIIDSHANTKIIKKIQDGLWKLKTPAC